MQEPIRSLPTSCKNIMEKFTTLVSTAVPLPIENVDTDQIIPARFLKATSREGFGENLFCDWRYDSEGKPRADFVLNNPLYSGSILIAGRNFGSGSSREHAAWAIYDYGFRVVVSSFFADIFKGNALNTGLLPVEISETFLQELLSAVHTNPETLLRIDLEKQEIAFPDAGLAEQFEIHPYKKMCLLNGYDDIDYLISLQDRIRAFEEQKPV